MCTSLATREISLAISIPLAPSPTTTTFCTESVSSTTLPTLSGGPEEAKETYLISKWLWNAVVVAVHLLSSPLVDSWDTQACLSKINYYFLDDEGKKLEQMVPLILGTRGTVQRPLQTTTASNTSSATSPLSRRHDTSH
jgi:hypothetical protein